MSSLILGSAFFVAVPPALGSAPATPVSPAVPDGVVSIATTCPTFSWVPDPETELQEVVVYELSGEADGTPERGTGTVPETQEPALWVRLPGGASSWSTPVGQCLEPETSYAWIVRSEGPEGEESWSDVARFEVVGLEELEEVEDAFERLLGEREAEGGLPRAGSADRSPAGDESAGTDDGPMESISSEAGGGATILGSGLFGNTGPNVLEFIVFGERALRLEPEVSPFSGAVVPNVIGGNAINKAAADVLGATIGGGGGNDRDLDDTVPSDARPNRVTDHLGTVGGGWANQAGDGDTELQSAKFATVSGGKFNQAGGLGSSIGGGDRNLAFDWYGTVAGGTQNEVGTDDGTSTSSSGATVGGGLENVASGSYATVPGGWLNEAGGFLSFAAGRRAKATTMGSFVWADSTDADFTSTEADQFLVRAGGGFGVNTTTPDAPVDIAGENNWNLSSTEGDLKIGNDTHRLKMGVALGGGGAGVTNIHAHGGLARINLGSAGTHILQIDPTDGVYPGADNTYSLGKSGNKWTEVWATNGTIQTSDRRLKREIADLEYGLDELLELRPVTFRWKESSDPGRHLGLVAQEAREVVPEVVRGGDGDGAMLGMSYAELVPLLVKAMQQQQERIMVLEAAVERLRRVDPALDDRD